MQEKDLELTTAQALIRYLAAQFITIDGAQYRLFGGGFGIFGHGNVTCLGEALYQHRDALPLYRGQNEQSMGFAAAAYAKYWLRQRMMFCTASAGPGTSNLLTAAALAHANRLPMLMLCGDTFATRLPDPVLQQLEHFGDPTLGVNDAFRAVSRYWDRITHPAQIIQSLPQAIAVMLDRAECGPAFIALPQDVQGWTFKYPARFFDKVTHRISRPVPDAQDITAAAALIKTAKRPLIIAGGGIQYGQATAELSDFATAHKIPVVETIAGRANMKATHPLNMGPIGVTGSNSANNLASKADMILALGTRLQDFTTGSWTAFDADAPLVSINTARHDGRKHRALPVIGDVKTALPLLSDALASYTATADWGKLATRERAAWDKYIAKNITGGNRAPSYAQAIGVVNRLCNRNDRIIGAAGGLPAELCANWRTLAEGTVDIEFGYSCMGYEIGGGWGARIAQSEVAPDQDTIVFTGDGSYLMLNSDIYSSVLTGKKLIILVLDNGGFAVINKLQRNTGNVNFNNLFIDAPTVQNLCYVDFASHARALGAEAVQVEDLTALEDAFRAAKLSDKTSVIVMKVDAHEGWTEQGHAWWEVGTPQVSDRAEVRAAHKDWEASRRNQRKGV